MKVEMMQLLPIESYRRTDSTFIVTGTGWRAFLQEKCLRLARWAGASDLQPYIKYERIIVDTTDIIEACHDQIFHIYKISGSLPSQIIVGKKEYYQLNGVAMAANFTLDSSEYVSYMKNGRIHDLSLNGIAVTVNPWMEGIVVVP